MGRCSRCLLCFVLCCGPAFADAVQVLAWNVESGGSEPETIADQLAAFEGYDIVVLSEAQDDEAARYAAAAAEGEGAAFQFVVGVSGAGSREFNDHLVIVWNRDRFELLAQVELFDLKFGNGRAPFAVLLRERVTGRQFWMMANHFHRNLTRNRQQAIGVREWVEDQGLPLFTVGDFNFDMELIADGECARIRDVRDSLERITRHNVLTWIKPDCLIKTHDSHDSLLDFAFANGPALAYSPVCQVVVREGDLPDDATTSDHRPIRLRFELPGTPLEPHSLLAGNAAAPNERIAGIVAGTERSSAPLSAPVNPTVADTGLADVPLADAPPTETTPAPQAGPGTTTKALLRQQLDLMRQQVELMERVLQQLPD